MAVSQSGVLHHWDESDQVARTIGAATNDNVDMNEAGEVAFIHNWDVYTWSSGSLTHRYDYDGTPATYAFEQVAIDEQGNVFGIAQTGDYWPAPNWGRVVLELPSSGGGPVVHVISQTAWTEPGPSIDDKVFREDSGSVIYVNTNDLTGNHLLVRRHLATGQEDSWPLGANSPGYIAIDGDKTSFQATSGIALSGQHATHGFGAFLPMSSTHEVVVQTTTCAAGQTGGGLLSTDSIDGQGRVVFTSAPHGSGQLVLATPIDHPSPPGDVTCSATETGCPDNCSSSDSCRSGCPNSRGQGANLEGYGSPSLSTDDLSFQASGLPPQAPALLFAGTQAINGNMGTPFGNGARCAGGSIKRLGVQAANVSGSASWESGILAATGGTVGAQLIFQVWYRDVQAAATCPAQFNLSNGYTVSVSL